MRIAIVYKANDKEKYMYNATIKKVYRLSHCIIKFHFYDFGGGPFIFHSRDRQGPVRVIEEMIHRCLPSPDDDFISTDINGLWKYCLHDLMQEKKDLNELL